MTRRSPVWPTALGLGLLVTLASASLPAQAGPSYLLRPERVFDGVEPRTHTGWVVLVTPPNIVQVGPEEEVETPPGTRKIDLPGMTLLPGLIDAHSHVLLHPYNETSWNDQVLKESVALRVARATVHARETLLAGFTTLRDLGSEGAGYADVGVRQAIDQGIIPGPRMQVATRALVATGSYGPKGFAPSFRVPLGAEAADGVDSLVRAVRDQIGKGADWVKVYADYRWGPRGEAQPTYSLDELRLIVETARSSGRPTVAHASTAEGMRRAVLAGVETIEHGDGAGAEVLALMAQRGVALCPTLAAGDAIVGYAGWRRGQDPEPERIRRKKTSFRAALAAGVTMCSGSDAGVFPHGENYRELELMVEYGMEPAQALVAATSTNARLLHLEEEVGKVEAGLLADLVAVEGNPLERIGDLRQVRLVMKEGILYRQPE